MQTCIYTYLWIWLCTSCSCLALCAMKLLLISTSVMGSICYSDLHLWEPLICNWCWQGSLHLCSNIDPDRHFKNEVGWQWNAESKRVLTKIERLEKAGKQTHDRCAIDCWAMKLEMFRRAIYKFCRKYLILLLHLLDYFQYLL